MKHTFVIVGKSVLVIFACIGIVFTGVFIAMKFGFTKQTGLIDTQTDFWKNYTNRSPLFSSVNNDSGKVPLGTWVTTPEWLVLKEALRKDVEPIIRAASISGVSPRLIVTQAVAEQLRLFTSQRQIFKEVFQPLRVLGTQTQFSLGVTGVKEDTARKIEEHLYDSTSPYYLGDTFVHVLDYAGIPTSEARTARFSDYSNHYYSYLYTGLFIKQIEAQWKKAGFDISGRPEIISTLFNLGFEKSVPKANPDVGGASLVIGGQTYTFGGLAGEFYYSDELSDIFPRQD